MDRKLQIAIALLLVSLAPGFRTSTAGAQTNAHDSFNVREHYSHTALKDFVPPAALPVSPSASSNTPSVAPNCNNGNTGRGGNWGNWGRGNWSAGVSWGSNNWGDWSGGLTWQPNNWNAGAWGNSGGGHVHCARCYWVEGRYQWQIQSVWIPDHWERQWTPPLYRSEEYDGQVYPVLVRNGFYADVYINGYYENQRVSVWCDGYWVCF